MKNLLCRTIFLLVSLLLCHAIAFAQGWQKTFGVDFDRGYGIITTSDMGYLLIGDSDPFIDELGPIIYIVRVDQDGNELWSRTYSIYDEELLISLTGLSAIEEENGDFTLLATSILPANPLLLRINAQGELLFYSEYIYEYDNIAILSFTKNIFGGYTIAGNANVSTTDEGDEILIINTNEIGDSISFNRYGGVGDQKSIQIISLEEEGLLIVGEYYEFDNSNSDIYLLRTNTVGDSLWSRNVSVGNEYETPSAAFKTNDDHLIITGQSLNTIMDDYRTFIYKTDLEGNIIWTQYFFNEFSYTDIISADDEGFLLVGTRYNSGIQYDLLVTKVDLEGNFLWSKTYGSIGADRGHSVVQHLDGYTIVGSTDPSGTALESDLYLLRIDLEGNAPQAYVDGKVFHDINENCVFENESGIRNWLLELSQDGNILGYQSTDDFGDFSFPIDTGSFEVFIYPPYFYYWNDCAIGFNIDIENPTDTIMLESGWFGSEDCSILTVDVGTPLLRRCYDNIYTITYCNDGPADAENVYIEVSFDEFLTVNSSTLVWSEQNGNTFTFPIDDLAFGDCGTFQVEVTLDCDSTILGQTHCVEAQIYADSMCFTDGSFEWDGPFIELEGECIGDSVEFRIRNTGADMSEVFEYVIIEDVVIREIGDFNLTANQTETFRVAADGSTIRLEAEQDATYPGLSRPTVTVEGCNPDINGDFPTGFVNQLYQNDADPFRSIDCQENVGSWDPNDKQGFPRGVGEEHCILPNEDLEYLIRFQNTGTDTAFRVVIRDTLSSFLNPLTIRPGTSSHPYDFELIGNGIVKFTFSDIMLPDSNINEVASHGFVKFKIAQNYNIAFGTVIENSAAIYFDYNAPVITNQTFHTVEESCLEKITTAVTIQAPKNIIVYPNPFTEYATFELINIPSNDITFHLFDQLGRRIMKRKYDQPIFQITSKNLIAGVYFYKIEINEQLFTNGKLVVY